MQGRERGSEPDTGEGVAFEASWPEAAGSPEVPGQPDTPGSRV